MTLDEVKQLEAAILERAERLAREYRGRAERGRDHILRDAHEQLKLREEREVLLAKAQAERTYRRRVQANELALHKQMDHLRWNLVEGVRERLVEPIQALTGDDERYLPFLAALLARGAGAIEQQELTAEVNARDQKRLGNDWAGFAAKAVPGKRILLSETPIATLGGIMVRSNDNRIRVDNTFEGRMQRLQGKLHQLIIERLLPGSRENGI
ncbi:MAG: V-type ATP synthase subunit E [Gammaproteobacteria bacterium]|nr:V-type ATP synthase subunit E [Gammaproteobacteria bacterium]